MLKSLLIVDQAFEAGRGRRGRAPMIAAESARHPTLSVPAARTRMLLEDPILPTLLRLAWPNVLVMIVQSSVTLIEAALLGRLGTDALAGVALVFPAVILMTMLSAGPVGGGIAGSIARALGSGKIEDARRIAFHAIVISTMLGLSATTVFLGAGRSLYGLMGGTGAALDAAATYSNWVFGGMTAHWVATGLASILRGTGNTLVPALVICIGVVLLVPISALLIFGWGPIPGLGAAGAGLAVTLYNVGATVALATFVLRCGGPARPLVGPLRWRFMAGIVRVGALGALNTVQTNVAVAVLTALYAASGPSALASYGIASRIEFLLIPLAFGVGAPLVPIVGTNLGAGQLTRAHRAAWTGAALGGLLTGGIGLATVIGAPTWIALFDETPEFVAAGSEYLRVVGPFYACIGVINVLTLAAQGAGCVSWAVVASSARLLVVAGGGVIATHAFGRPAGDLAALVAFGLAVAAAIHVYWIVTWSEAELLKSTASIASHRDVSSSAPDC